MGDVDRMYKQMGLVSREMEILRKDRKEIREKKHCSRRTLLMLICTLDTDKVRFSEPEEASTDLQKKPQTPDYLETLRQGQKV